MFYKDKSKASCLIQSASNNICETEIEVVQQEVKKKMANNHYENIPLEKNQWTGNYPVIHGTKAAIDCFSKTYAKLSLKRTIVNPRLTSQKNWMNIRGDLKPTEVWALNTLNMNWVKRNETTGKDEPCAKFLEEVRFWFQCLNLFQSMIFH